MTASGPPETEATPFYRQALHTLTATGTPFMLAGAYALGQYTGIFRETKDLDVFCTPGDYPVLLEALAGAGYETQITDANWIAKAFNGEFYVDLIFDASNGMVRIDQSWFEHAPHIELFGLKLRILPVTELIWAKLYIQDRHRYDGADVNHLILKQGQAIDWRRLLQHMDRDWKLLFAQILNYQFVYPSEREQVPEWVVNELLQRLQRERDLPIPQDKVTRGPLLSRTQYDIDLRDWGFKTT